MRLTLYKLNLLIRDYPLFFIIDSVNLVQQGQSDKSTIVEIKFKNFIDNTENLVYN